MSLVALFLQHVSDDRRARCATAPDLEATLADLTAAARSAWPEIAVAPADFLAFLGRGFPDEIASAPGSLRAGELYLACGYGLGVPGASDALEEHYLPRVRAALGHLGVSSATVADILQELRQELVEMQSPRPDRKGYGGRGDLGAWLCVVAVRRAARRRERGKREAPMDEVQAALLASPDEDPEMDHLRSTYKQEFQAAFVQALASLTSRERNLLHYHFLEGRSIDQIGALYGVHRATAARWINLAREALCARTRELLAERVSLSHEGFLRMLSLIASRIDVGAALARA